MTLGVIGRGIVVLRGYLSYRVVALGVIVPRVVVLGVVVPGVVVLEPIKLLQTLKKSSSDTGQICIVNIYGPVMCSLCEKCVGKYRPKFSQNHMVRN